MDLALAETARKSEREKGTLNSRRETAKELCVYICARREPNICLKVQDYPLAYPPRDAVAVGLSHMGPADGSNSKADRPLHLLPKGFQVQISKRRAEGSRDAYIFLVNIILFGGESEKSNLLHKMKMVLRSNNYIFINIDK